MVIYLIDSLASIINETNSDKTTRHDRLRGGLFGFGSGTL